MKTKIDKQMADLTNPAPLTPELLAELKALEAMADDDIDTSDIPPLTDASFQTPYAIRFTSRQRRPRQGPVANFRDRSQIRGFDGGLSG